MGELISGDLLHKARGAEVTDMQWDFVRHFVEMGGKGAGEPAALQAGYSPDSAKQMAYKLLRKAHIRKAVYNYTRILFATDAARARAALVDLVDDEDCPPAVRRAAALDILNIADAESKMPSAGSEGTDLRSMDLSKLTHKQKKALEEILAVVYSDTEAEAVGEEPPGETFDGEFEEVPE